MSEILQNQNQPQNGGEKPSRKPLEQIRAEKAVSNEANKNKMNAFQIEEEKDKRIADIKLCVENDWDYCGQEPKIDETANQIAQILYDFEESKDPDYDITKKPLIIVKKILASEVDTKKEQHYEQKTDQAIAKKATAIDQDERQTTGKQDTKEAEENLKNTEALKGFSEAIGKLSGDNLAKISEIATWGDRYPEQAEKAKQYLQILSVASSNKQDYAVISERINTQDFSKGVPDPVQFVRWAVFSSDGHESGVSETTQNAIATSLGIARNEQNIRSRDDMYKAWKDGAGTETYLDENGNEQTRKIPFTRDNMAEIAEGQYLYEDSSGANVMRVELTNGKFLEAAFSETNNVDAEDYGRTLQIMGLLAESNMLKPIYKRGVRLEAGGRIPIDPVDIRTTEKITQVFADVFAGQDDQLFSPEQLARMEHVLQVHSPKGDYEQQDRDPDAMEAHLKAQGILDKNGDVNWQRWKEIVDKEREATYSSARDFSLYQKAA